jgi:hypothetical protein
VPTSSTVPSTLVVFTVRFPIPDSLPGFLMPVTVKDQLVFGRIVAAGRFVIVIILVTESPLQL